MAAVAAHGSSFLLAPLQPHVAAPLQRAASATTSASLLTLPHAALSNASSATPTACQSWLQKQKQQQQRRLQQQAQRGSHRVARTSTRAHGPAGGGQTATAVEEGKVDRAACPTPKPEVSMASLDALDIRVGVVTDASTILDPEVSKQRGTPTMSRKFLKLKVDIGYDESRVLVSECRFVMDVEDAVGKKVLVVANVEPCTVLGEPSHGVILAGLNYDPTPMPRSFKLILPGGLGRLPPGSQLLPVAVPPRS